MIKEVIIIMVGIFHYNNHVELNMNSFVAGTLILTSNGLIPIENIKVGHKVLTRDPLSNVLSLEEVESINSSKSTDILKLVVDSAEIKCTVDHLFWIDGKGWMKAKQAVIGDRMVSKNGVQYEIKEISNCKDAKIVYDFTPSSYTNYFISELEISTHSGSFKSAQPHLVVNLLSNFKSELIYLGSKVILIDKSCIKHILERHHPLYHNNVLYRRTNSFLSTDLSVTDIVIIIKEILNQNRTELIKKAGSSMFQIRGKFNGVHYILGMNYGRVGQLYPLY